MSKFTKKGMAIRTLSDTASEWPYISLLILTLLNRCISVKTSLINANLGGFVNLGVLFLTIWINSCLSNNLDLYPVLFDLKSGNAAFLGHFNENPSMQAAAKDLQARASEHSSFIFEQFKQRPTFASTFQMKRTILYPYKCTLALQDD